MIKTLLSLALVVMGTDCAFAQTSCDVANDRFSWVGAKAPEAPSLVMRAANNTDDGYWWSYRDPTPQAFGGWESPETYVVGIYLPDSLAGYEVDSIRYALGTSRGIENLRIWAHMGIPDNFQDADIIESVKKDPVDYHDGCAWNTAEFSEPVLIEAPKNKYTKCCIGFAFDQTVKEALHPLAWTESDPNFSFWMMASKNFSTWGSFAYQYGAYSMSVHVSKPDPVAVNGLRQAPATVEGWYTTDGRRHNAPQKGVNIVRYSDGSVARRIVR